MAHASTETAHGTIRFSLLPSKDNSLHKTRSISRCNLSSRGKLALVLSILTTLLVWFVLEYTLLLQSTSLFPSGFQSPPPQPPIQSSAPKMIDIILLNTELDLLEIRLHELFYVVDTFVIIESNITFSGHSKRLHYKENMQRFEKFRHKIHYVELSPMTAEEKQENSDSWGNEHYTRNKGVSVAIQELQPQEGDWLLLSDLDEVPRPAILMAMKYPEPGTETASMFLDHPASEGALDLFRLECRFYYYSYEYYKGSWMGPVVMRFRERESHLERVNITGSENAELGKQKEFMATIGENDRWTGLGSNMRGARFNDAATVVDDACWHCSWCFSHITEVIEKSQSYSHSEHNQGQYQEKGWILDHYRNGVDLFERASEVVTIVQKNFDIPDYIRYNRHKYLYMLERYDAPNAGFVDEA